MPEMAQHKTPHDVQPMPGDGAPMRLAIRVIPRSKKDEVGGERAGRLLVRTTAAPVDDAANAAVRRLMAAHLNVPLRRVEIVSGHHSRDKVINVTQ